MSPNATVSIVIPAFNQLEYCRQCVDSIIAHTNLPYKLILVDNGSTDGVGQFFDSIAGAVVVHTGSNLGFPAGVNRGLQHAEGHVCLLNSDTIAHPHWMSRMIDALESTSTIGAVGPMSNCVSGPQLIEGLRLTSSEAISEIANSRYREYGLQVVDIERLVGFCLLVRDKTFDKVGLLDESFGIGNFEDDDYCMRIRQAGFRTCMAPGCFLFHYGSRTFAGMGFDSNAYAALMESNANRFMRKWSLADNDEPRALQAARAMNMDARDALNRGEWQEALRKLSQSIAMYPAFAPAFNDLGAVLWQFGDKRKALDYFVRAVSMDPTCEEARANARDAANALGVPWTDPAEGETP